MPLKKKIIMVVSTSIFSFGINAESFEFYSQTQYYHHNNKNLDNVVDFSRLRMGLYKFELNSVPLKLFAELGYSGDLRSSDRTKNYYEENMFYPGIGLWSNPFTEFPQLSVFGDYRYFFETKSNHQYPKSDFRLGFIYYQFIPLKDGSFNFENYSELIYRSRVDDDIFFNFFTKFFYRIENFMTLTIDPYIGFFVKRDTRKLAEENLQEYRGGLRIRKKVTTKFQVDILFEKSWGINSRTLNFDLVSEKFFQKFNSTIILFSQF